MANGIIWRRLYSCMCLRGSCDCMGIVALSTLIQQRLYIYPMFWDTLKCEPRPRLTSHHAMTLHMCAVRFFGVFLFYRLFATRTQWCVIVCDKMLISFSENSLIFWHLHRYSSDILANFLFQATPSNRHIFISPSTPGFPDARVCNIPSSVCGCAPAFAQYRQQVYKLSCLILPLPRCAPKTKEKKKVCRHIMTNFFFFLIFGNITTAVIWIPKRIQ